MKLLGIDTGGTFTDFVLFDGNAIRTHKVLSTPSAPEKAILQGIHELGITLSDNLQIIHGSTVATNAVLEGKGARTVYISNRGFKDVLTIGRQARKELYNLTPTPVPPPVPQSDCLETGGRLTKDGNVLEPLTESDISALLNEITALDPEAIAINLLFSYRYPRFEDQIASAMPEHVFVSCSSKICPVYREYERGITTWLNSYVGPVMQGYISRLQSGLDDAHLSIMRSSGNTCDPKQAGQAAVNLLLSGPAGGLTAANYLAKTLKSDKLLTFDMGGTSTDVALLDGKIELTGDGKIAGYPVAVSMVNIHTIGAGGGSIAYVDDGGLLQVGPESAGASPGPACYGQGGQSATVTDANLLLGRIPRQVKFGESLAADFEQAKKVISQLATRLGLVSAEAAAEGIIRITNEHMAQALRVISVERGIDPRGFAVMAFGGAGGLHVCELAEQLGMRQAIVPNRAGVLSALGMLVAEPGRQLTQTLGLSLSDTDGTQIENAIQKLVEKGKKALLKEGHQLENLIINVSLDLCYHGQAHALEVSWAGKSSSEVAFHRQHLNRYGYQLSTPVELVNVRVGVKVRQGLLFEDGTDYALLNTSVDSDKDFIMRAEIQPGQSINGAVTICDPDSTIWVAPGWIAEMDKQGHIVLTKNH
ncbi:MAG: hydantoinase/oxoprolinase family protein [Proteobacteria bacterium]|nr:hydantoinase/oxoprolinase family protein [Pseudomonadota bacterium]